MRYTKFDINQELRKAERGLKTRVNLVSVLIAAQPDYPERVARAQAARGIELEFTSKCCGEKHTGPALWRYCPMCGNALDVTVRECEVTK